MLKNRAQWIMEPDIDSKSSEEYSAFVKNILRGNDEE